MRVIVCGGGIGGLVLAQALRAVADVTVLERDRRPADTGGYRLHLDHHACAVLGRVLDPAVLAEIRAVSDPASSFTQFTVANRRLDPILIGRQDPGEDRILIQRQALRLLLTRGVEGRVRWGTAVAGVRQEGREPRVLLADGRRLAADLVVAADGSLSPTIASLLGTPTSTDLGLVGIAGSTPVSGNRSTPGFLRHGPALAFAGNGTTVFLTVTAAPPAPVAADVAATVPPPSVIWSVIMRRSDLSGGMPQGGAALIRTAAERLAGWDPWLTATVRSADPSRTVAFPLRSANHRSDLTPWRPGNTTALGDAVHAMPPTGGLGAATAIRGADHLARAIASAGPTGADVADAVAAYEAAMPTWAVPAIRQSLHPVRVIRLLGNPVLAAMATPLLAGAGAVGRRTHRGGRPRRGPGSTRSPRTGW